MKYLNLYYWANETNVGDVASFYVVSHISKNNVRIKSPFISFKNIIFNIIKFFLGRESHVRLFLKEYLFFNEKVLLGIGSILDYANQKCLVWGSGFREYGSKTNCKQIYAVRGYLSLQRLNLENKQIAIGDPAILLPYIYQPNRRQTYKQVSIIPHYKDHEMICTLNNRNRNIINIMTNDVEEFIDQIVSSKFVLSTSLHGVIIAHAYHIPALWIKCGYVGSSDFKYYDYFSSVRIEDYPDLRAEEVVGYSDDEIFSLFELYNKQSLPQINVEKLRVQLLASAPFELKDMFKKILYQNEKEKNTVCN